MKMYTLCEGQTLLIFFGIKRVILNLQGCKNNNRTLIDKVNYLIDKDEYNNLLIAIQDIRKIY